VPNAGSRDYPTRFEQARAGKGDKTGAARQVAAHLHPDRVRVLEHITRGESKQTNSRREHPILTAVVLYQAGPMRATVVFEPKPVTRVVEIGPTQKTTFAVVN
jgi:hypothetical protein